MNTLTDSDILEHIATLDNDGLNEIIELVKSRRDILTRQTANSIRVGQSVEFEARGATWTGTVTKVNRKTVAVMATCNSSPRPVSWKVTASLLRMV
jgi:hypothetical protein